MRDTRTESPSVCPRIPSCPAASAPSLSPTKREKEILCWSSPSVSRQPQVLARCESPARAITKMIPQPSSERLFQSLLGPVRQIRKKKKPALMAIAMRRSGSCALDGILNIDQTLREWVFREVHIKDAFGVSQCFGAVDILPVCVADIKCPQFVLPRHLAHAVRERAVSICLR